MTYQDTFIETETIGEDNVLSNTFLHYDTPEHTCPLYVDATLYLMESELTNKF